MKHNRLLNNLSQGLETSEKYQARSNTNSVINISVNSDAPINMVDSSTTTTNSETMSLNSRAFSVVSPITMTNNVLSIDESNLVTQTMFDSKQVALKSGTNVTVNGTKITAVDTTYSAGVGLSVGTDAVDSSKHPINMVAASKTVFGGVFTDSNSKNLTIESGVLKIASDYNVSVEISNTAQEAYYSNNVAGYQPRVSNDGNGKFTVHAGIKWTSDTSSTLTTPYLDFTMNGNHVGFSTSAYKYSMNSGAGDNPIFMNNGLFTGLSENVSGSDHKPVYMSNGVIKEWDCTIGSDSKPTYLSSGVITPITVSAGNIGTPVYFTGTTFSEVGSVFYRLEYNTDGKWGSYHTRMPGTTDNTVMGAISELMTKHGLSNLYFAVNSMPDDYVTVKVNNDINCYPQMNIMIDDMEIGKVYTIGLKIDQPYHESYFTTLIFNTKKNAYNGTRIYAYGFSRGELVVTNEGSYLGYKYDHFDSPFSYSTGAGGTTVYKPMTGMNEGWAATPTSTWTEAGTAYYKYVSSGVDTTATTQLILPLTTWYNTPHIRQRLNYLKVMRGTDAGTNSGATLYLIDWG